MKYIFCYAKGTFQHLLNALEDTDCNHNKIQIIPLLYQCLLDITFNKFEKVKSN